MALTEPTADTIRAISQVDFDDIGFEEPTGGDPDKLAAIVEGAILWIQRVTGRIYADLPETPTTPDERWINWAINQAVQMQTEYKCFVAQPDIAETAADFNQIASFSAADYSETRRSPNARTRGLHPWTDLADLLADLMTDDAWMKLNGEGPGIRTDDPDWDVGIEIIDAHRRRYMGPFGPGQSPWDVV